MVVFHQIYFNNFYIIGSNLKYYEIFTYIARRDLFEPVDIFESLIFRKA